MLNGVETGVVLWVLLGSAFGGAARYLISETVARGLQERFPWGTLVVNVSGAVIIGAWFGAGVGNPVLQAGFVLGFLGSYTTVSSFALQSLLLFREGRWHAAAGYALMSSLACLLGAAVGYAAGNVIAGGP
ncbi:MAG: CrcB family protein [Gammaproteobacteria bacterium]|nr:CrcB family protein [Gammaproteobacteria bacterium]